MTAAAACPHCGSVLDPPPASSRKCPECRGPIVVRTRKGTKLLFTPTGAEAADRERAREVAANKARRHASNIGVDDDGWHRMEQQLTGRFGRPPSAGDVFWSLANEAIQDAMRSSDWHRLQMLYFEMALHLKDEGRDFRDLRRESLRCSVRHHIAQASRFGAGEPLLRVLGCRPDCEVCRPDAARSFRAGELLADDAPVPHDCEWCACGVIFDETWWDQHAGSAVRDLAADVGPPQEKPRGLFGRLRRS